MSDLVEFLRARLDEDEQAAREAGGAPWSAPIPGMVHVDAKAIADNKLAWGKLGYVATVEHEHDRNHITRHDPARVLREVKTKRWLVDEYEKESWVMEQGHQTGWTEGGQAARETALKILAAVYVDHPDYRQEWRPA